MSTVAVIGGGATGLGVAWDLLLRGVGVVVIEKDEIAGGTSGRFHGLLHSGARYAVTDPVAARGCAEENAILRTIAPGAIAGVGGVFLGKESDSPEFGERWLAACESAGIAVKPAQLAAVRAEIPGLASDLAAAYRVQDAVLEGFRLLEMLVRAIQRLGGEVFERTRACGLVTEAGEVRGLTVESGGERRAIGCDAVVNAAGPWAGEVGGSWGGELTVRPSRGTLVIFANRHFSRVVNRLAPPGNGDIFVPHGRVLIFGTTDTGQESPEPPAPLREEVVELIRIGQEIFPALARWRVIRAFNGVRPLYQRGEMWRSSRELSRDFVVFEHSTAGGPKGAFSVIGGKWTTFRLIGEKVGDLVAGYLGVDRPSASRVVRIDPLPPKPSGGSSPIACECEGVTSAEVEEVDGSVTELRLRSWFAMGPCQGTFCAHRVLGMRDGAEGELTGLRAEREKGILPAAWGDNARMLSLQRSVRFQSLGEPWDG